MDFQIKFVPRCSERVRRLIGEGTLIESLVFSDMAQHFSASGRPIDNAVAESFFATFKKEEAYCSNYHSEAEFRKSVDDYITFYNEKRPHFSRKYKTPVNFEKDYFQQLQK